MWHIAAREIRAYISNPFTWLLFALLQILLAWFFLVAAENYLQARDGITTHGFTVVIVSQLYSQVVLIFWLIFPLLSMSLISAERRQHSLALLLAAPLSNRQIIWGKYLGLMGFSSILLLILWLMPASLYLGGTPDWAFMFSAWLGLCLLSMSFAAIGLYFSCLSPQPTLAALGSVCLIVLLWGLNWISDPDAKVHVLRHLSLATHYAALLKGQIRLHDISYFILLTVGFLLLSEQQLNQLRKKA
jgi:ABC-2 type transport system permease protein